MALQSCNRDNEIADADVGIPTTLSGNVYDYIKNENVKGYKIKFVKSWRACSNWMCGLISEEIATTYTDENGNYEIKFNYNLKEGEEYGLEEQYYGTPYVPEYDKSEGIIAGKNNTLNIKVWQPIKLTVNLNLSNNINKQLVVGNKILNTNSYLFNTEFIYEGNTTKELIFRTKPNSDISIDFWYYENYNSPNPILHRISFPYHTSTDEVSLDFDIDCSTF